MRHSEILLKTCFVEQLAHNNWQGCPKLRGQCGHEVEPNSMQLRRSCWPHTVWKSVTEATFLDPKYSQNPISLVGGTRCNLFLLFVCACCVQGRGINGFDNVSGLCEARSEWGFFPHGLFYTWVRWDGSPATNESCLRGLGLSTKRQICWETWAIKNSKQRVWITELGELKEIKPP